ncbi:MAG: hypothetical protein J5556_07080 [Deltaproteobacteria bacterium]|nr:hypothetical protein [Deltaproteobacteria bacterium]
MANNTELRLRYGELQAFLLLAGFSDALIRGEPLLEERLRLIPGGWRDFRLMRAKGEPLVRALHQTFPKNKRDAVFAEWKRLEVSVDPKPPLGLPQREKEAHVVVPLDALEELVDVVTDWECTTCMLDGKQQKACKLRKRLESLYLYDLPEPGGLCPFALRSRRAAWEGAGQG